MGIPESSIHKPFQPMKRCESTSNRSKKMHPHQTAILLRQHQMSLMQAIHIAKRGSPIAFIRRGNQEPTLQVAAPIAPQKQMARPHTSPNNGDLSSEHGRSFKWIVFESATLAFEKTTVDRARERAHFRFH
jgi:hypothetical protein